MTHWCKNHIIINMIKKQSQENHNIIIINHHSQTISTLGENFVTDPSTVQPTKQKKVSFFYMNYGTLPDAYMHTHKFTRLTVQIVK